MINEQVYLKSIDLFNKIKYTIDYCKQPIYQVIITALANKLINLSFFNELNDEQKTILTNIANR